MEYSIQEVAKMAGTTSRTLRHYGDEGLLEPARVGTNGYRYYDQTALVRLQRILLLRELGLGLPAIKEALASEQAIEPALQAHVDLLQQERKRIDRQITSIERTIKAIEEEGEITMEEMLDGFDHTQYREEVEAKWGKDAYEQSAKWWESKSEAERQDFAAIVAELNKGWIALAESGTDSTSDEAQAQAAKHVAWLKSIPGTPGHDGDTEQLKAYVTGLGEMYVADERFAANYGGTEGATFVRDALVRYADQNL